MSESQSCNLVLLQITYHQQSSEKHLAPPLIQIMDSCVCFMKSTPGLVISTSTNIDFITVDNKTEPEQVVVETYESVNCEKEKCITLTFDDGPSVLTGQLLDTLKAENVPAVFFTLGQSSKIQPDTIRRIKNEGHELGNHSWNHKNLVRVSQSELEYQIQYTDAILSAIVGEIPPYFRPPYGTYNNSVIAAADRPVILWNVDPEDWKKPPREELIRRMTENIRLGSIILAHDIHQWTVDSISDVITILKSKGYVFVSLENLLEKDSNREIYHSKDT